MISITWLFFLLLIIWILWQGSKRPKLEPLGKIAEEKVLELIRRFVKWKDWENNDYLLINNLILQKDYWSCEIDILLLTRKWVYIIEVKDWSRGWLDGKLNDEYLEWSLWVGRELQINQMYSPFYQNQQHINRFIDYFQLMNNQNILSIICFNGSRLKINLKEENKFILKNNYLWTSSEQGKDIFDLLHYCEMWKKTQLTSFEQLKEKISKEVSVFSLDKVQKHRDWVETWKNRERR